MRYQTFADVSPLVGIVNEPLLAPLVGAMNGWTWRIVVEVDAPGEGARGQRPVFGVGPGAGVGDHHAAGIGRAGRGLRDRAGRRLVRAHRQHGFVAQDVAEIVGDQGAEARAVVGCRDRRERVVLRGRAGMSTPSRLPLVAQRRRARGAHAEGGRRAWRHRSARRMRGDGRARRAVVDAKTLPDPRAR